MTNTKGELPHLAISFRCPAITAPRDLDVDGRYYSSLVQKHPDALQAGAPFPDYLYSCGSNHDAGEEAHW
jgi:hypothetical protein